MITSTTDICNLALGHLGEAPITSLDEDSRAARACALHFVPARDAVLRSHRWNFAETRVALSRLAEPPPFGWAHQFPLPVDCSRVLEVNGSEEGDWLSNEYRIEGRVILTNVGEVNLVYTRLEEDVSAYDPLFIEALALKLAALLSEPIRGTTSKTGDLMSQYERVTAPLARRVDANEGRRRKGILPMNSMFIRARGGGI
jgi:hypothetical protein